MIQEANLSTNEVQWHLQAVELRGNLPAASHMQVLRCNAGRTMHKQVISMESDMTIHGNWMPCHFKPLGVQRHVSHMSSKHLETMPVRQKRPFYRQQLAWRLSLTVSNQYKYRSVHPVLSDTFCLSTLYWIFAVLSAPLAALCLFPPHISRLPWPAMAPLRDLAALRCYCTLGRQKNTWRSSKTTIVMTMATMTMTITRAISESLIN